MTQQGIQPQQGMEMQQEVQPQRGTEAAQGILGMQGSNKVQQSMKAQSMTCVICPMGCQLQVSKDGDGNITVTGNTCPRGAKYARKELTCPTRTLTCTVKVTGGVRPLVAAKSNKEVPRGSQVECMQIVRRAVASAPIKAGDVLVPDILGTGADIIAVENVD